MPQPISLQQPVDNFVYQPPTSQAYQYKIYINECDSYIGSQLVEHFRNDHIIQANPNIIIGSSQKLNYITENENQSDSETPLPSGVDHVINISNQRLYNSVLLQADIILFTLHSYNIQQFQYLLKLIQNSTPKHQQKIICISSLISWGKTKAHAEKISKDQLHLRNPLNCHIKILQNLCLNLNNINDKLKGSVVFSGLVYGYGEDKLFPYFKRALQQEKPLEIYGKGTNHIPTIHLQDLAQILFNIAFRKFEKGKNWHFACDFSNMTQKQIITLIAQNVGNGSVIEKPIEECFINDDFDFFTMDLDVQNKEELEEWHCKQGLKNEIESIIGEFNQYRGLKPNKIFITGPPVSGKSTIAEILRKNYGLPVINIKNLIQDIKKDETQFGKEIQGILQQIRIQKVEQQRKAYQEMKKKKKGKGVEDFVPNKIVPRLPDESLRRVIQWRLGFSDCLNKGYILDSVIKTYKMASEVFTTEQGRINQNLLPNSVFVIKATDDQIKQRVKSIPNDKIEGTHWNEEQTVRRLHNYAKQNEQKSLRSFFQNKIDIKQVQIAYQDQSIFAKFVERNGPLGFKKEVQQQPIQPEKGQIGEERNQEQEEEEFQEDNEDKEGDVVEEEFNLQKLTQKEQKILNEKSRPIRQYLIDNVIPEITEGLLEICKEVPEDPIDFLIGFLQRKSEKKRK